MSNYDGNDDVQQTNHLLNKTKEVAAKKVKKSAKKAAKKVAKKAAKVAVKAAVSAIKVIFGALLAAIGPVVLIIIGLVIVALLLFSATTMFFGGGSDDELGEENSLLKKALVAISETSVDMSDSLQEPYAISFELIISIMQLYVAENEGDPLEAAQTIVDKLKPTFEFANAEEYKETYTKTCDHNGCTDSAIKKTPSSLRYISNGEMWNGTISTELKGTLGDWISTTKKTAYTYKDSTGVDVKGEKTVTTYTREFTYELIEEVTESYSYFESVLMAAPFEYDKGDIEIIAMNYSLAGGVINYGDVQNDSMVGGGYGVDMNVQPGAGVPAEYMQYYLAGQKAWGVDWYYIAAIHYTETKFSTHKPMVSSVGAEGHTQFMPCTWIGWSYPGCKGGVGFVNAPASDKENPTIISKYGGYGVDADGDGKASPWSLADAIMATAKYLSKNGFSTSVDSAIMAYNRSQVYVDNVKAKAVEFKNGAVYTSPAMTGNMPVSDTGFVAPTNGRITSSWGGRYLPGQGQDFHAALDISNIKGTVIVSIGSGVVKSVHTGCPQNGYIGSTCGFGWGNHVRIMYNVKGTSYEAVYAHLSQVNVKKDVAVQQGQIIGLMGSSGSSTGSHLHIELHTPSRGQGNPPKSVLNPVYYLPLIKP